MSAEILPQLEVTTVSTIHEIISLERYCEVGELMTFVKEWADEAMLPRDGFQCISDNNCWIFSASGDLSALGPVESKRGLIEAMRYRQRKEGKPLTLGDFGKDSESSYLKGYKEVFKMNISPSGEIFLLNSANRRRLSIIARENFEQHVLNIIKGDEIRFFLHERNPQSAWDLYLDIFQQLNDGTLAQPEDFQYVFKELFFDRDCLKHSFETIASIAESRYPKFDSQRLRKIPLEMRDTVARCIWDHTKGEPSMFISEGDQIGSLLPDAVTLELLEHVMVILGNGHVT